MTTLDPALDRLRSKELSFGCVVCEEPDGTLRVSDVERHNSDHVGPQYYLSTGEIFDTKKALLDDLAK